jgi:hypothetical protein
VRSDADADGAGDGDPTAAPGSALDAAEDVGRGVGEGKGEGEAGGREVAVGEAVGEAVGAGVGGTVGVGVTVGFGVAVGVGVGAGVGDRAMLNVNQIVGKVPEPHDVEVAPPGLSAAIDVHVRMPEAVATPLIRNTALSPTGRPTNGFLSEGFLNVTIAWPDADPVTTTQPWDAASLTPFTDTIDAELRANELGIDTRTQVSWSPPLLLPTF